VVPHRWHRSEGLVGTDRLGHLGVGSLLREQ
jgi:hypothetical protein